MKPTDLVAKIKDLPTLPAVAAQINDETQKESLTAKSLGAIIIQDSALTAKVLKLANSAFYGLISQVDTIDRAVTVLGMTTIKNLALTVSVYKFFQKDPTGLIDMEGLWLHSLGCAVAARFLVKKSDPKLAEKAFVCGIIHDIGINIIANNLTDEMILILGIMHDTKESQATVEKEILGFSHARLGSVLAETWNFPAEYANAIRLHHNPSLSKSKDASEIRLITAVHIGNKIAKIKKFGKSTDPLSDCIPPKSWHLLNYEKKQVAPLLIAIDNDFRTALAAWDMK